MAIQPDSQGAGKAAPDESTDTQPTRCYFVCERCNSKWFAKGSEMDCPPLACLRGQLLDWSHRGCVRFMCRNRNGMSNIGIRIGQFTNRRGFIHH